jgi:16S rRNA (guanine1516-N2)-methyltransferase
MPSLIITTALSTNPEMTLRAEALASELGADMAVRGKRGLPELVRQYDANRAIVVESAGLALVHVSGAVYRYHPNLGYVRALNLLRGQRDLFADAADIRPGERVLDCTAGFGSEAMLAAMLVGPAGVVTALESVPELAVVTREGLQNRKLVQPKLEEAMRRIEVVTANYMDYLRDLRPGSFDLICFDPFFEERTPGSGVNIDPLLAFGDPAPLDPHAVLRAMEVASRRVLIKHPVHAEIPEELYEVRNSIVSARHRPVAYSVFDAARR